MKCKSCGHEIDKRQHRYSGHGRACIAIIDNGINKFNCGCANPKPKVIEVSEEDVNLIGVFYGGF